MRVKNVSGKRRRSNPIRTFKRAIPSATQAPATKTKNAICVVEREGSRRVSPKRKGLKQAVENLELNADRYKKQSAVEEASYQDLVKNYGKKAADKIRSKNLRYARTKHGW